MLRSGGWGDADAHADAIDNVTQLLKLIHADDALISASAGAFRVKPEKRRRFDTVVEQGVVEVLEGHMTELDSSLAKCEALAEDIEAEALGLWAILDCARDKVAEVQKEIQEAKAAHQKASAHCDTMGVEAIDQTKIVQDATSRLKLQTEKIDSHAAVIGALDRLRKCEYDVGKSKVSTKVGSPTEKVSRDKDPMLEICSEPLGA